MQSNLLVKAERKTIIISPKPKRPSAFPSVPSISNPFITLLENKSSSEDETILNELKIILNQPETPKMI